MIHYHGVPITPETVAYDALNGRHAFVSFVYRSHLDMVSEVAHSFALDNGAFSAWRSNKRVNWSEYYKWVDDNRNRPGFDFAVIPDVIDGTEQENDDLVNDWPLGNFVGSPVWHVNESFDRLQRLSNNFNTVCIGSSGEWDVKSPAKFLSRVYPAIASICDDNGRPRCKLHGLRMLNPRIFTKIPLSSGDSTSVARNIKYDKNWRGTYIPKSLKLRAAILMERIESHNSPTSMPLLPPYSLDPNRESS